MKNECPECGHQWTAPSPQHVAAGKARAEAAARKRMEAFLRKKPKKTKAFGKVK